MDEKEIFSMVEKPRVRYDVEVVTKLIVYAGILECHYPHCTTLLTLIKGIAWLSVEGNPLLFELIGLGMGT